MVRLGSWWQNLILFYCKLGNFWFVWWSVNTNNNYGTIVWKRNPYHTKLIICMTHCKIGHMCRCVAISHKHRDVASDLSARYVLKPEYPWTSRQVLAENHVSDNRITSAARLNSDANQWNSSKFLPNERYVFVQCKKISNLGAYNIIESWSGEVFWVINIIACYRISLLSSVSLSGLNIWSNSAAGKFYIVFETIKLFNDFLYPQGWLEDEPVFINELW